MSNSEREEFEKRMIDGYDFSRDKDGDYIKPDTFEAYNGWQAARAESAQRPSVAGSEEADKYIAQEMLMAYVDGRDGVQHQNYAFGHKDEDGMRNVLALLMQKGYAKYPPATPKRVQIPCPAECDDGVDWSSKTAEVCKTCEGAGTFYATPPITDHAGDEKDGATAQDEHYLTGYNDCKSQLLALLDSPGMREEMAQAMSDRDPPQHGVDGAFMEWEETPEGHKKYCRKDADAAIAAIKKRVGL